MAVHLTLVALENTFGGKAIVSSHLLTRNQEFLPNKSLWLNQRTRFRLSDFRVYTRTENELKIELEGLKATIQNLMESRLNRRFYSNVTIGANYTDNLPFSNPDYANVYIVVSCYFGYTHNSAFSDVPVKLDLFYGFVKEGNSLRVVNRPNRYRNFITPNLTDESRSGRVIDAIERRLGLNYFNEIGGYLERAFNKDDVSSWYVIPGNGEISPEIDEVLSVGHNASFFYMQIS